MSEAVPGPAQNDTLDFKLTPASLLRFAAPSMVMMLFMGLYTMSDSVMIARYMNTDGLSALNIVCPVINLMVGLGGMAATGGSALVAQNLGAGMPGRARREFSALLLAGGGIGLLFAAAGLSLMTPLLHFLGASGRLLPYCRAYLLPILIFAPAGILSVMFQNLLITAGRPGLGMALSIGSGIANISLDFIFMGPLQMGMAGAALGTCLGGYLLPTAAGLLFFSTSKGALRLSRPQMEVRRLLRCLFNGSSELVSQCAAAVTTLLFNLTMMRLHGETGVAAITILIYSQFLLCSVYFGFSMGAAPLISYQYGAGNGEKLRALFRLSLGLLGAASLCIFAVSLLGSSPLIGLFAREGTTVFRLARKGFPLFSFSFLFSGVNIFTSAAFTALANGKISALLSGLRTFVFLTAGILLLPRLLDVAGLWIAVPLAESATFLFSAGFLLCCRKRYRYG